MARRTVLITLHWSVAALLIALAATGPEPRVLGPFTAAVALWCALALAGAPGGGPGPRLSGTLRRLHPWSHRGLYLLLAVAALTGWAAPGEPHRLAVALALGLGALHGVFNLWRHTALLDGALRRITPRALHGIL